MIIEPGNENRDGSANEGAEWPQRQGKSQSEFDDLKRWGKSQDSGYNPDNSESRQYEGHAEFNRQDGQVNSGYGKKTGSSRPSQTSNGRASDNDVRQNDQNRRNERRHRENLNGQWDEDANSQRGRSDFGWASQNDENGNQSAYYGQGRSFGHHGNYGQSTGYGSRPLGSAGYGHGSEGGYGHGTAGASDNTGDHGSDYGIHAIGSDDNKPSRERIGSAQFGLDNEGTYGWGRESGFRDNNVPQRQSMGEGAHRGKGPKGYRRSDERIKEDISDRLTDDQYLDATDVEVYVEEADVILTGTVESRQAKRRAEDLAEQISGVGNVENRLRVRDLNISWKENSSTETDRPKAIDDRKGSGTVSEVNLRNNSSELGVAREENQKSVRKNSSGSKS